MIEEKIAYNKLSAEFYDLDPTYPPEKEVAFLTSFIEQGIPGLWLEAMSGSGRILIPLLQKGYTVEGVDNSPYMLTRCRERMRNLGLHAELYDQSVTELALPKKYSGIIICFASFQLLPERYLALQALRRLKEHLLPGGMVLIDIFIPWQSIKRCIVDNTLLAHARIENAPAQDVADADGMRIERRPTVDIFAKEQTLLVLNEYTKFDSQGTIVATEREEVVYLWYYRYEMVSLLEQAGFTVINIIDQNEEMVTYQAL